MKLKLTDDKRYLQILKCTQQEYDILKAEFTKRPDGYLFNPLYKQHKWDGFIRFYNGALFPGTAYKHIQGICQKYGFQYDVEGIEKLFDLEINREDFVEWVEDFFSDLKFKPRNYQIDAAYRILKARRCMAGLATSAGKTLISFMVFAYLFQKKGIKRILMIVPTVSLVLQSSGDFEEYNSDKLELKIQQLYAGMKLKDDTNILVSTFQSLANKPAEFYKDYDCVFVDETHKAASAKTIQNVLDNLWHCDYRFGMSGTIPKENTADFMNLLSYLGPIVIDIKAKQLQDQGYISNCKIHRMFLNYSTMEQREAFYRLRRSQDQDTRKRTFNLEQQFVIKSVPRMKWLCDKVISTPGNSLILFHYIDYGKALYKYIKSNSDKHVFYISGEITPDVRDEIKKMMEENNDCILIATYQCIGTGVSINRIFNIFFAESYKSINIVLQAIGRGLRKKAEINKDFVDIYDLIDDISIPQKHAVDGIVPKAEHRRNYLIKHAIERKQIYEEQSFEYEDTQWLIND